MNFKKSSIGLGVRKDATSTRRQMEFDATVSLVDKISGRALYTHTVRANGGYDILDSQFANIASEQNITDRLLDELADDIQRDLDLYLKQAGAM